MTKKFTGSEIADMLKRCTSRPLNCTDCAFCNRANLVEDLDCQEMLMREAYSVIQKYMEYTD